jgi:hypothetical protein
VIRSGGMLMNCMIVHMLMAGLILMAVVLVVVNH